MIPLLQRAFGIDQQVGDVLNVAHLPLAAAHLQQRVVGGALRIGRIKDQHAAKPRAPAGGQRPVLPSASETLHGSRPTAMTKSIRKSGFHLVCRQ
jgi:hypothetical protein